MEKTFYESTTKEKCTILLLSCMNWGYSNIHCENGSMGQIAGVTLCPG